MADTNSPGAELDSSQAEYRQLQNLLVEQIEKEDYREAQKTAAILLRLNPSSPNILDAWAFLDSQLAATDPESVPRLLQGHRSPVHTVCFSSDGRLALSGSGGDGHAKTFQDGGDRSIRLWDVENGKEIRCFSENTSLVVSAAFSPGGTRILACCQNGSIHVWDVDGRRLVRTFGQRAHKVHCVALSPDGRRALSACADGGIRLWDVESGRQILRFHGHTDAVTSVAYLPVARRAISGSLDQTIRIWDLEKGCEVGRLDGHKRGVLSVAVAPGGQWAASGGCDRRVRLWSLASGKEVHCFKGHSDVVYSVAFSSDQRWLLSGGADKTMRLWEVSSGQQFYCFNGHQEAVDSVAFAPNSRVLLSGSADHTVGLWELPVSFLSTIAFVDTLRQSGLLSPAQLAEFTRDLLPRFHHVRSLVWHLLERGWLTPYQIDRLVQGGGNDLMIGEFVLLEWLGKGGMAHVYKARHRTTNQVVALKVTRPELITDAETVGQYLKEFRALAKMSHPNIVKTFVAGRHGTKHYFAMEFVQGIDLEKLVQLAGPLPVSEACDYIRQAALGLQHAHETCLVHRDIKPANLLLSQTSGSSLPSAGSGKSSPARGGVIKILDWGLASLCLPSGHEAVTPAESREEMIGTADYLAPEQAKNARLSDIRSDLYSLGCTFYYLLAGQPPFPGGSLMQKLLKHQQAEPTPIDRLRPDLPKTLVDIIRKMMAKRSEERYRTPAAVVAALRPFCYPSRTGASAPVPAVQIRPGQGQPPEKERRASIRYPCDPGTSCRWRATGTEMTRTVGLATVHDISTGGIGLIVHEQFELGTRLTIELRNATQDISRRMQAQVIHTSAVAEEDWRIGCAFDEKLSTSEVQAFQHEGVVGSAADRRVYVRHPWNVEMAGYQVMAPRHEQWNAKVLDISSGGIGLLVDCRFENGTLLSLELPSTAGKAPFTMLVRVVHITAQSADRWVVGCSFAAELSEDKLRELLAQTAESDESIGQTARRSRF